MNINVTELKKALKLVGLNAVEAETYITCLKIGTQETRIIAEEIGLSIIDTLACLLSLCDMGIMSKIDGKKAYFSAKDPEVLLHILHKEHGDIEKKIYNLTDLMPMFKVYRSAESTRPAISFYEGDNGLISAWEDTLTSTGEILAITAVSETESALSSYVSEYYKRRKAAGILIRAIFSDSELARKRQEQDENELRISKLVPKELLNYEIELNIYNNKIAFFSMPEKFALVIESTAISNSMRDVFEICWRNAGEINDNSEQ